MSTLEIVLYVVIALALITYIIRGIISYRKKKKNPEDKDEEE